MLWSMFQEEDELDEDDLDALNMIDHQMNEADGVEDDDEAFNETKMDLMWVPSQTLLLHEYDYLPIHSLHLLLAFTIIF